MQDLTFLRPLVRSVLEDERREWTSQGFGFLRTYFGPSTQPKRFRLNLWNSQFAIPNVSTIHDHPWHFKSVIVAGQFVNLRYAVDRDGRTHHVSVIRTGEQSDLQKIDPHECGLSPMRPELYAPGEVYSQAADEVHETLFKDGTVTLNERIGDTEHARVFWPYGQLWVDAKPRKVSRDEIENAITHSLEKWF